MEEYYFWFMSLGFFFILLFSKFITQKYYWASNHRRVLPPSPPSIPIIGHLHLLRNKKEPLHRTFHKLSKKYGHVLFLRLGVRNLLVISSPSAVEECFTKNDVIFANRPRSLAGKHLNYNYKSLLWAPYGDYWRTLRRLTTLELFSAKQLTMLMNFRKEEVRVLLKELFEDCGGSTSGNWAKVELRPRLKKLSFNVMMKMIAGKRYYSEDGAEEEASSFRELIKELKAIHGISNLNDFFPVLQVVDFQGVEKRMMELMKKMDRFFQNLIDEHRRVRSDGVCIESKPTLIDIMLSLQQTDPEFYTDETMKGVITSIIRAGTESASTAVEWSMSLLLNHPDEMKKARAEIEANVGLERPLDEADLPKLEYLQKIYTEAIRLYPPAPLLVPRESSEECTINGFHVPRGTQLLVNAWSIHRDPELWENPTEFMPYRFGSGKTSGTEGCKMIPFGVGRRACSGAPLGKRLMGLILGALIQCFDWEKIDGKEIDMAEGLGQAMAKAEPFEALCKPRQDTISFLSTL
ncbi:cytochrome P450 81Q32-like [Rosa rugosa]|uniref:cytochrome P450 81Q32-like n=1 Tax=Rosa rugosa TaxID=74645 RepID=UPI002B4151D1|nr:cytochrome P450 81Q32-like [Rosa rugosa]